MSEPAQPRRYRHTRYHYPRFYNVCLDPDNCVHTTEVPGESCECCGEVILCPEQPDAVIHEDLRGRM